MIGLRNDTEIRLIRKMNEGRMKKEILEKIRNVLRVMNPVRVESLALQLDIDQNSLRELLKEYIDKNVLNVKIINDSIFSPTSQTMNI